MVHFVRVRSCSLIHVDFAPTDTSHALCVCTDDVRYCCHHIGFAIVHCHCRGIVHRDIKLENIAMHGTSITHGLCLLDFGLAESHDNPSSHSHAGTPAYRAPSRAVDGMLGCLKKADVWSFGITLFASLHGYLPMIEACVSDCRFRNFSEGRKMGLGACEAVYSTLPVTARRPPLSESMTQLLNNMLRIDPNTRADAHACVEL